MNKKLIGGTVAVMVIVVGGIFAYNTWSESDIAGPELRTTEQDLTNIEPAPVAQEGSFGVVTAEEKAALDAAAAAAQASTTESASSTATSSATSTPESASSTATTTESAATSDEVTQ